MNSKSQVIGLRTVINDGSVFEVILDAGELGKQKGFLPAFLLTLDQQVSPPFSTWQFLFHVEGCFRIVFKGVALIRGEILWRGPSQEVQEGKLLELLIHLYLSNYTNETAPSWFIRLVYLLPMEFNRKPWKELLFLRIISAPLALKTPLLGPNSCLISDLYAKNDLWTPVILFFVSFAW